MGHLVLTVKITCPQTYKQASKQASTCHTEKISHPDLTVRLKTTREYQGMMNFTSRTRWTDLTHTQINLTHVNIDLICTKLDLTHVNLTHTRSDFNHVKSSKMVNNVFKFTKLSDVQFNSRAMGAIFVISSNGYHPRWLKTCSSASSSSSCLLIFCGSWRMQNAGSSNSFTLSLSLNFGIALFSFSYLIQSANQRHGNFKQFNPINQSASRKLQTIQFKPLNQNCKHDVKAENIFSPFVPDFCQILTDCFLLEGEVSDEDIFGITCS